MKKIDITPQELCERLFNGESFYNASGARLFVDDNCFRYETVNGSTGSTDVNNWLNANIYTKPHWTDNLSEENPVLCWVWDSVTRDYAVIRMICRFDSILTSYKFEDLEAESWVNAEPVKLSEACIWEGE